MSPFAEVVGAAHVATGTAADAVAGVVPRWVVRPADASAIAACVRAAAHGGLALAASGLGAHLDLGAAPRRLDALLRLDRLARIVDHEAADMTVTAEAGCSLPTLATALGSAGQWMPLDPPRAESTTVGGLVAANLAGPLRCSQGTVRDLLLGVKVVGADGALVSAGGRVVKNVAGYDLPKLHVGALGTLGVVVEATFKVRPRPAVEAAVLIACEGCSHAGEVALAARDRTAPLWLECAGPGVLEAAACVVVGLGGIAEEVDAARETVLAVARARGLAARAVADGAGLRARLGAAGAVGTVLRAATVPAEVGAVMARLERAGARVVAHAANGVVRGAFDDAAAAADAVAALRPALEAAGGALVVERAQPALLARLDPWGDPGPGMALMRRVKQAFDPGGLLAPGRFVGGL